MTPSAMANQKDHTSPSSASGSSPSADTWAATAKPLADPLGLPRPKILRQSETGKPLVSIILIDWGVRESFHSLHYLNRQTVPRTAYELIWLEFSDRQPQGLQEMIAAGNPLDQWVVAGYPTNYIFHKHRLYNLGIVAARGDICVICDSDAMFSPTFVEKLLRAFRETPNAVIHLDEVRNVNRAYYPFKYPSFAAVLGEGCINWEGKTTLGLNDSPDRLHHANYGACMAAWREDLLAIGGADEHLDYLGYVCGPYELTFRLLNYGRVERWLTDEYLFHTWHPNQYGHNADYQGPHDGMHMALLALEARATFRVRPYLGNPWLAASKKHRPLSLREVIQKASDHAEPTWQKGAQLQGPSDRVYWVNRDFYGFDIFFHAGTWYGLRTGGRVLNLRKLRTGAYSELWTAPSFLELQGRLPIDVARRNRELTGGWWPARLWHKFRSQPLRQLPQRLARKMRRLYRKRVVSGEWCGVGGAGLPFSARVRALNDKPCP